VGGLRAVAGLVGGLRAVASLVGGLTAICALGVDHLPIFSIHSFFDSLLFVAFFDAFAQFGV
jgi:hypothetical protein